MKSPTACATHASPDGPELGQPMQEYLDELRAPVLVVQDNARVIDSILLVGQAFFITVTIR